MVEDGILPLRVKFDSEQFRGTPYVTFDSKRYEVKAIGYNLVHRGVNDLLKDAQSLLGGVSVQASLSKLSDALGSHKWPFLEEKSLEELSGGAKREDLPPIDGSLAPEMTMEEIEELFFHLREVRHVWKRLFDKNLTNEALPIREWKIQPIFWDVMFDLALCLGSVPLLRWIQKTRPLWDPNIAETGPQLIISSRANASNHLDEPECGDRNWCNECDDCSSITRLLAWARWDRPNYPFEPPRMPFQHYDEDDDPPKVFPRIVTDLLGAKRGLTTTEVVHFGENNIPYVLTSYTEQQAIDTLTYMARELGAKTDSLTLPMIGKLQTPLSVAKALVPILRDSGSNKLHYTCEELHIAPTIQWLKIFIEDLNIIPPPTVHLLEEALYTWDIFDGKGTFEYFETFQYLIRLASPGWCQIAIPKDSLSKASKQSSSSTSAKKTASSSSSSNSSSKIIDYGPPILVFKDNKTKIDLGKYSLVPAPPIVDLNMHNALSGMTLIASFEEIHFSYSLESREKAKKLYLASGGFPSTEYYFVPPNRKKEKSIKTGYISEQVERALLSGEIARATSLIKERNQFEPPPAGKTPICRNTQIFYDLVRKDKLESLKLLHKRGWTLNRIYLPRHFYAKRNNSEKTHEKFEGNDDWPYREIGDMYYPLLLEAVKCGNFEMVKYLREEAKCSWSYYPPHTAHYDLFTYACIPRGSKLDWIKKLDVNQSLSSGDASSTRDNNKASSNSSPSSSSSLPERITSEQVDSSVQMMMYLESQLVLPNLSDHNIMDHAIMFDNLSAVKWLVSRGLSLENKGNQWTALRAACIYGRHEIVEWIFETYGVEQAYEPDAKGDYPFDCALLHDHYLIIDIFERKFCLPESKDKLHIKTMLGQTKTAPKPDNQELRGCIPSFAAVRAALVTGDKLPLYPCRTRSFNRADLEYRIASYSHRYMGVIQSIIPRMPPVEALKLHSSFSFLEPTLPVFEKVLRATLADKGPAWIQPIVTSEQALEFFLMSAILYRDMYPMKTLRYCLRYFNGLGIDIMKIPIRLYQRTWMEFEPARSGAVSPTLELLHAAWQKDEPEILQKVAQAGCRHPDVPLVASNILVALARFAPLLANSSYQLREGWAVSNENLNFPIESEKSKDDGKASVTSPLWYTTSIQYPTLDENWLIKFLTEVVPDVRNDWQIISQLVIEVALVGSIPMLEWLLDFCNYGNPQEERYCYMMLQVSIFGTMEVLEWLANRGFPMTFSHLPNDVDRDCDPINVLPKYSYLKAHYGTKAEDLKNGIIKLGARPHFSNAVIVHYGRHNFVNGGMAEEISERTRLIERFDPEDGFYKTERACFGWCTLHFLAFKEYTFPAMQAFIRYQLRPPVLDTLGRSAVGVAKEFKKEDIVNSLGRYMSK